MRIAQVAPLIESVPPRFYGGTERIVSYLTEELVRQGHEVTLFASGDSVTPAELVACTNRALRMQPEVRDALPYLIMHRPGAAPRARVRRPALSHRLSALPSVSGFRPQHRDHPAWPAGSARSPAGVRRVPGDAPGLDLGRSAAAVAPLRLAAHGPPRPARRTSIPSRRADWRLSRLPRPDLPGEAAGPRDRDRAARRHAAKIAAKVDRVDQAYFDEVIRPLLRDPSDRVRRRDRRSGEGVASWAAPGRSCFRSTGPSRSGW